MADARTLPVQDNGATALLAQIFSNSAGLFGSGTTTSKETTNPLDLNQSNQVLGQVLQGTDPKSIDDMIQGILDKAKDAFGPNISNSIAGGNRALTDTTLATIQGKAQGTATAQAAQAKLDAIAKNNQIAATIVDSQVAGQARVAAANTTKTATTTASPTGKALSALGAGASAYSLFKKATDKTGKASGVSDIYDAVFGNSNKDLFSTGVGTDTSGALGGNTAALGQLEGGFSEGISGAVGPTINAATDSIGNLLPTALDTGALFDVGTTAAATDVLGTVGGDLATSAAIDTGAAIGADTAIASGVDAAGAGIIDSIGADVVGSTVADAGIGEVIAETVPLFWVICTELNHQGKLTDYKYREAAPKFMKLSEVTKDGYHFWAVPYVKLMKHKKYGKFFTNIVNPIAQKRVNYLNNNWNLIGWLTVVIGEPICYVIGKLINFAPKGQYGRAR